MNSATSYRLQSTWKASSSCRKLTGTLFLALSVVAQGVPAEPKIDLTELSIEQLMYDFKVQSVYGASKHKQTLAEAPSAVTIIDATEIAAYGHRRFSDVLNSVRSLYVSNDRNYHHLGVRGFDRPGDYSSRVLVLINGHRVNENVLDSVLIGHEFPLEVDLIQRVEVIRGPSSSIYGNNAFFGVINVITKDARALEGITVRTRYGSLRSTTGSLTYGKVFSNKLHLIVSASYYNSDGNKSLYYPEYDTAENQVNDGLSVGTDYERYYKTFASAVFHDFTLEASYSSRKKGIPTGSYGSLFNDTGAQTIDRFGWVDLKFDRTFGDNWHVLSRASYDVYHYHGNYPLLSEAGDRFIYSDNADGTSLNGEVQVTKRVLDRHTFTVGAELRENLKQDQGNRDNAVPPSPAYKDHRQTRNNGVYAQAELRLRKALLLNMGVRSDYFGTFGATTNPRFAVIYDLTNTTTLKALYGKAFKAPNAYELYYSGPSNKGNLNLRPETISTYELVLEQVINKTLNFVASGFSYRIKDLVNQTLDPADELLVYRNSDRVTARGVEMEMNGTLPHNIRGRFSYTYQQTKDELTGQELSNSPRSLAKGSLSAPLWKDKLSAGLEALYSGEARTLSGREAAAHCIVNLTLISRRIVNRAEASLSVYNVFNTSYSHPAAGEHLQDTIEQNGRTFRGTLTYRF